MQQPLYALDPAAFLIVTRGQRPNHARPARRTGWLRSVVRGLRDRVTAPTRLPQWVDPTAPPAAS